MLFVIIFFFILDISEGLGGVQPPDEQEEEDS